MNFVPTEDHVKINLEEGLAELMRGKVDKLYSEGLEEDEYIHYIKEKGFCFEDGTVIGKSFVTATENLIHADWTTKHPFYIKLDYEKEKEKSPADINTGIYHYGMYSACYFCTDIAGEIKDKYIREYEQSGRGWLAESKSEPEYDAG